MLKGERSLSSKLLIVIIFFIADIIYFIYEFRKFNTITGFSVKDDIYGFYNSLPLTSKIFILIQLIVLVGLVIYASLKDRIILEKKKNPEQLYVDSSTQNSKTELDSLYLLLKEKKEIPISAISKTFNIDEKLAMEWGKILESTNLARIDYPRFGPPILRLLEFQENLDEE